MTGFEGDADLPLVTEQTDLLLETIHGLDDDAVRGPSRCAGWTRAHVLNHLARNADGLAALLEDVSAGRPAAMYASQEQRNADIEAGVARSAADLESDVEIASDRWLEAVAETPAEVMDVPVPRLRDEPEGERLRPRATTKMRLREVVIHHVDLDAGYGFEDAPPDFVLRELAESARRFTGGPAIRLDAGDAGSWRYGPADGDAIVVHGTPAALLGWVTGRTDGTGLTSDSGSLPALGRWG